MVFTIYTHKRYETIVFTPMMCILLGINLGLCLLILLLIDDCLIVVGSVSHLLVFNQGRVLM
jgi:hypothetical protein